VDAVMSDAHAGHEDDPEPKESGSEAIERRIEKIMSDLREQGVVDEKVMEAKKVCVMLHYLTVADFCSLDSF